MVDVRGVQLEARGLQARVVTGDAVAVEERPLRRRRGLAAGAAVLLAVRAATDISWQWYALIGSVTTNVGHLEAAAGRASANPGVAPSPSMAPSAASPTAAGNLCEGARLNVVMPHLIAAGPAASGGCANPPLWILPPAVATDPSAPFDASSDRRTVTAYSSGRCQRPRARSSPLPAAPRTSPSR